MNDIHQPRPEFVEFLQWQIKSALQRQDRFNRPVRLNRFRYPGLAALVLVSIFCGAAGVVAIEQAQESRQKELLIAQAEMELKLTELQLQILQAEMEQVQYQYEADLIDEKALVTARRRLKETEIKLICLRLDIEEIGISGEEPQNDLSAPRIGGRDFVMERLQQQVALGMIVREEVEKEFERNRHLYEAGVISQHKFREAQVASVQSNFAYLILAVKIKVRERFLKGEITEVEVIREVRLNEIRNRLQMLKSLIEVERARCERLKELFESGSINEVELLRSQVQLLEQTQEMEYLTRLIKLYESYSSHRSVEPIPIR